MIFIDAHNLIKRIYHGGGNPYTLFYNLMVKYQEYTVEVVCDGPRSRDIRKAIHSGYKAGRNQGDDPVYWEVYNNCMELARYFKHTSVVKMTAGEADDYIATYAMTNDIVISNDKDLWGLVTKGVTILLNASTKVDEQLIEQKFKGSAKHILLYKALVGDPSDKIPGKRGFGPAAWAKLNFEDRELYAHHFALYFRNGKVYDPDLMTEQALMSWELAKPIDQTELDWTTDHAYENKNPLAFIEEKGIVL